MKTNWSRCFSALVALLVLVSAAAPAAGVTTSNESVPTKGQVGEQISATVTLSDLYADTQWETWQLTGGTELRNVVWTVTFYDQTGSKVDQKSFSGRNFTGATVAAADGTSEVRVNVTGTVPAIRSYSYDPAQSMTLLSLDQTRESGARNELATRTFRPYTTASANARAELDNATAALADSSANTRAAEHRFDDAVQAYSEGSFGLATSLAIETRSDVESAERKANLVQMAVYGVGGLLAAGLAVGGLFFYRSRRNEYDRLG